MHVIWQILNEHKIGLFLIYNYMYIKLSCMCAHASDSRYIRGIKPTVIVQNRL